MADATVHDGRRRGGGLTMAAKPEKPKATAPKAAAKPKFGSPAWNAKYGIKRLGKKPKGK